MSVPLKDAVRQDLRLRMEQPPSDGEFCGTPTPTHQAPGSSDGNECEDEGGEEEVAEPDPFAEAADLTSRTVPPPDPFRVPADASTSKDGPDASEAPEVVPAPLQDGGVVPEDSQLQEVDPAPLQDGGVVPEASKPQEVDPAPLQDGGVVPEASQPQNRGPNRGVAAAESQQVPPVGTSGVRTLDSTEFAASEPEETPAPESPEHPKKRPSAVKVSPKKLKPEKKPKAKPEKMKKPSAAPTAKKRPAAAVDVSHEEGEGTQKKSQSLLDCWPWVDAPDGPHLRECVVGEWKAGLL